MARIKGVDNVMVTRSMIDPKDGKVEIVPIDGNGKRLRVWPIDAKEIVSQGKYKLVASPLREESVNNQNTDEGEETSMSDDTSDTSGTSDISEKKEPEEEFNYDIPNSAPGR